LSFRCRYQTDCGKKRQHNEDFLDFDEGLGLFIVCDGMGGHQSGDVASKLAAQGIKRKLVQNVDLKKILKAPMNGETRKVITEILHECINQVNRVIYNYSLELASDQRKSAGMGTTLVMALKAGEGVFLAHVGDSRAYLLRGKNISPLTIDHSFVNELLEAGQISAAEARNHPQRNVITRAMGISEAVCPDITFYEVMPKDMIILCSDGLHGYFSNNDFLRMRKESSFEMLTQNMIDHALKGGGKDNITVMALEWESENEPPLHPHDTSVQTKIETLQKINLFKSLTYKETSQLLEIITVENCKEQVTLVKQGEAGEEMYVILKGEVNVIIDGQNVTQLKPGNYFGEMSLIDKNPRSATVISQSACRLMKFKREELFLLLKREPRIGLKIFWGFLQTMNRRLRDNNKLLQNIESSELSSNWDLGDLE